MKRKKSQLAYYLLIKSVVIRLQKKSQMKLLLHFEIALLIHYFLAISLIYIGIKKEIMADLSKVFQQFANTANEGEKAVLDTKKVKRALKVNITMSVLMVIN